MVKSSKSHMKPGNIFWVDVPKAHCKGSEEHNHPGSGSGTKRPWIVVNARETDRGLLWMVPTSASEQRRGPMLLRIPAEALTSDELAPGAVVLCGQLRAIDPSRLEARGSIGSISSELLDDIVTAIRNGLLPS